MTNKIKKSACAIEEQSVEAHAIIKDQDWNYLQLEISGNTYPSTTYT
jgi:hypothetical protein